LNLMKKPYLQTGMVLLLTAALLLPVFISCSSHSEGASFTKDLDVIDNCITSGDTKEALSLLRKVSKHAYSSYARIGIYKRYMILGEKKDAEKTLVVALKKIPKNSELTAVYTHFLLREGRIDEALERSRLLSGTEYGSLYAESVFRAAAQRGSDAASVFVAHKKYKAPKVEKKNAQEASPFSLQEFFRSSQFVAVYADAWKGTKNVLWLRNAAVLNMRAGTYANAVLLAPTKMENQEESLFWGTIYFDANRYGESLAVLLEYPAATIVDTVNTIPEEIAALVADDYYILGDEDSSQNARLSLLAQAEPYITSFENARGDPLHAISFDKKLSTIIPIVYINNARYAYLHGDIIAEYDALSHLVSLFPEYEPGLAAYGQFALDTLRRPPEDYILQELRAAGLRTILMEQNDAIPKVAVADAIEKIDATLAKRTVPALVVLRQELLDETDTTTSPAERISRIWKMLEQNETGTDLYPPEIMRYAVSRLIALGARDKGESLFMDYLHAEYKNAFNFPAEKPELLSLWECEAAAWFAADRGKGADSKRLYEFIIEKYAGRTPIINSTAENSSVIHAYINLASLYTSYGEESRAYDLLNEANARITEPVLKSEILFRMAELSNTLGDVSSARMSLQKALSINPSLNRARLLLKQIK